MKPMQLQDMKLNSEFSVEQVKTSGKHIATITIADNETKIFASEAKESNNTTYCTQFEVLINDKDITSGMIDSNDKNDPKSIAQLLDFDNTTATGLSYTYTVPACMTHQIEFKCELPKNECDIIVDWGDETIYTVKDLDADSATKNGLVKYTDEGSGEWRVTVNHTYEKNGKYIVSCYGNTIWGLRCHNKSYKNCISRIFDYNLKISPYLRNVSSIAQTALKLLKIEANGGYWTLPNVINAGTMFAHCANLKEVSGFENIFLKNILMNGSGIFQNCVSLEKCDYRVPSTYGGASTTGGNETFLGCYNLQTSPDKLLPLMGFTNHVATTPFYLNHKLTAPAKGSLDNFGTYPKLETTNNNVLKAIPSEMGGYSDKLYSGTKLTKSNSVLHGKCTINSIDMGGSGELSGTILGGAQLTLASSISVDVDGVLGPTINDLNTKLRTAPEWIYTNYKITGGSDLYTLIVNTTNNVYINSRATHKFLTQQSGYPWSLDKVDVQYTFDLEHATLGGPIPIYDASANEDEWLRGANISINKAPILHGVDFDKLSTLVITCNQGNTEYARAYYDENALQGIIESRSNTEIKFNKTLKELFAKDVQGQIKSGRSIFINANYIEYDTASGKTLVKANGEYYSHIRFNAV